MSTYGHGKAHIPQDDDGKTQASISLAARPPATFPPPRIGVNGEWHGRGLRASLCNSTCLRVMPFPHQYLCALRNPSKPSAGLLCSLSSRFELVVNFRHIFLELHLPILLFPTRSNRYRLPKTSPSVAEASPQYEPRILLTMSSVSAPSSQYPRSLSLHARCRTRRCGIRASVSARRGTGKAWSGEPAVACRRRARSGSTSHTRRVTSQKRRLSASAPSAASSHPDGHIFLSCTAGSTPILSEDAAFSRR